MDLSELKKMYGELAKKYKMPSFKDLNESFEIEKIDKQSDTILRVIRKVMMEKIVNSLGFVEMLSTGMNSPRMYIPFIKTMTIEDRTKLEKMYNALADLSMSSLEREVDYNEKKEAELIIKVSKAWTTLEPDFRAIMASVRVPRNSEVKKDRGYFG